MHQGHNRGESFASEVFISQVFARQGRVVELVNEQGEDGLRRFDALVDGEEWEFKELTDKATNIQSAFQRGLSYGASQAQRIAYHVNRNADIGLLNAGLNQAIYHDKKKIIQVVALVFQDGSVQQLRRKEIDSGRYF
ncbi:hypothetical protein RIF25_06870 [Thermosynechococcaceae cyanobacterium BACA0444]|uniref:tRNA nuclease CdiA C-terminal domain-containing protein n=1 Tax=Pseudocalidococcus azoricus BACA0444 TaxID=2918990 RepID=A0AAE4FT88_9CYAN|nr:hypothetical protein [Pseudocalidococcus azoricus]MDS3860530.1 hypothetical protein [Pseudocalidococcus azoricus BACA0444]